MAVIERILLSAQKEQSPLTEESPNVKDRLYICGYFHSDGPWYWGTDEINYEFHRTMASNMAILNLHPEAKMVVTQVQQLKHISEVDPELFKEIQQKVLEGRVAICATFNEGDQIIVPEEMQARQLAFAKQWVAKNFQRPQKDEQGKIVYQAGQPVPAGAYKMTEAVLADNFGLDMLAKLYKKAGYKSLVISRPAPHEMGLRGNIITWLDSDGSEIYVIRLYPQYPCSTDETKSHLKLAAKKVDRQINASESFVGFGDHAGGVTQEMLIKIQEFTQENPDIEVIFGTPEEFREDLDNKVKKGAILPVVTTPLEHHARGSYVVDGDAHQALQQSAYRTLAQERISFIAHVLNGFPISTSVINDRTEQYFKGLFHDWNTCPETIKRNFIFNRYSNDEDVDCGGAALDTIAYGINVEQVPGMIPLLVVNPNTSETTEYTTMSVGNLRIEEGEKYALIDPDGNSIPWDWTPTEENDNGRRAIIFKADRLAPLGWKMYRFVPNVAERVQPEYKMVAVEEEQGKEINVSNGILAITFNKGVISQVYHRQLQWNAASGDIELPVVTQYRGKDGIPADNWLHHLNSLPELEQMEFRGMRILYANSLEVVVVSDFIYRSSTLTKYYHIRNESDEILVDDDINWREKNCGLKIKSRPNISFGETTTHNTFGHRNITANGELMPTHTWTSNSGKITQNGDYGSLSILSDSGINGVESIVSSHNCQDGNSISIHYFYDTIYGHHWPAPINPNKKNKHTDIKAMGKTHIIKFHKGDWFDANIPQRAQQINMPFITLADAYNHLNRIPHHDDKRQRISSQGSIFETDTDRVVTTMIAGSPDGSGYILRAYDTGYGSMVTFKIKGLNLGFSAKFNPGEVKTFLWYPGMPIQETTICGLQILGQPIPNIYP